MTQSTAARRSSGLFPRTQRSLANAAARLEARQRIERELGSLSDRALADIGLYRSDISEFAYAASTSPASEPIFQALAADFRRILRGRKAQRYSAPAAE